MARDQVAAELEAMFARAVDIAHPARCLEGRLPLPPPGRTFVCAAGKAAASMAAYVERAWPRDALLSGVAVTRDGHGVPLERIELLEAAHPVPDARSASAARAMLEGAASLGPGDLLLALISGGGSALMVEPLPGISLAQKQDVNRALLRSGASITQMNTVRRHMSAIKGGGLAKAAGSARVVTLAISDVPGDRPETIASGPTVSDPSTLEEAVSILKRIGVEAPAAMIETPKHVAGTFEIVMRPADMITAFDADLNLGADIEGEAREVGIEHAALALAHPGRTIVSGGETTVTIAGAGGRGGRNVEYLLALAIGLDGAPVHAIACDTDGIDGSEDNAGAIVTPDTLARARALGMDARSFLDAHDAYTFFERLDDLVVTGPTRTNVNDFRAIIA